MVAELRFSTLPGIPLVSAGDDLASILLGALRRSGLTIAHGDVLVVAQKIVSKAEGRLVDLASVQPTPEALALAEEIEKDPRLTQLILDESTEVIRKKPGVIIVRHRLGHVGANAGIDQSNIEHGDGEVALLLPVDPDRSAALLHDAIRKETGRHVAVIVADSLNRPWRLGTVGAAIGCAGLRVLDDLRGGVDMFGRELKVTMVNRADSLAATASLLMGETTEATPAVLIQGLGVDPRTETARAIARPLEEDMFR